MIVKIMQTSILFKATGRSSKSPVVILTGLPVKAQFSTSMAVRLSRALSSGWYRTKCCCTPRRILRALFSNTTFAVVAAVAIAAMIWHLASVPDTLAAQRAVGIDILCLLPWALVWAFRTSLASFVELTQKGGEA